MQLFVLNILDLMFVESIDAESSDVESRLRICVDIFFCVFIFETLFYVAITLRKSFLF